MFLSLLLNDLNAVLEAFPPRQQESGAETLTA